MRTMMRVWMIAVFVAALAIASGCEDSPLTAGKDFTMGLVANPSSKVIVPPATSFDSTISATVLNATGVPKSGLTVYFTTTGGVLDSNGVIHEDVTVTADKK